MLSRKTSPGGERRDRNPTGVHYKMYPGYREQLSECEEKINGDE